MRGLERGGATLSAGILALSATSAVAVPEESKESVEAPASVIEQASEAYRERDEMQESLDAASEAADVEQHVGGELPPIASESRPSPSDLPDAKAEFVGIAADPAPQNTSAEQEPPAVAPEPEQAHNLDGADSQLVADPQLARQEPNAEHPSISEGEHTSATSEPSAASEPVPDPAPEAEPEEEADLSW